MDPQVGAVTKFLAYRLGQTPDTDLNTCPIAHQGGHVFADDTIDVGYRPLREFQQLRVVLDDGVDLGDVQR